jgi:hypothetical protein
LRCNERFDNLSGKGGISFEDVNRRLDRTTLRGKIELVKLEEMIHMVHPGITYLPVISCQSLLGSNTIEGALNRSPIPLSCMRAGWG